MTDPGQPGDGTDRDSHPLNLTRVVGGALLVVLGVVWLLTSLDTLTVAWRPVIAMSLVVVGAALAWGSRSGRHGGLISLGVVLTLVTMFTTVFEVVFDQDFAGGVGERRITADDTEDRRLAIGSLTVDLRGADITGDFEASVGIGELVVLVDDASLVTVSARVGIGEVVVFDRSSGGIGAEVEVTAEEADYRLTVSVGIGKVEVRE